MFHGAASCGLVFSGVVCVCVWCKWWWREWKVLVVGCWLLVAGCWLLRAACCCCSQQQLLLLCGMVCGIAWRYVIFEGPRQHATWEPSKALGQSSTRNPSLQLSGCHTRQQNPTQHAGQKVQGDNRDRGRRGTRTYDLVVKIWWDMCSSVDAGLAKYKTLAHVAKL